VSGLAEHLEVRVTQLANDILEDRRFDDSLRYLCWAIPSWFRADERRIKVFGDLGQVVTVATGFARQGDHGVTMSTLIKVLARSGFASQRRVRAICHNLERLGAVSPAVQGDDRRQKPILFNSWLEAGLILWLDALLLAASPWLDRPIFADKPALVTMFRYSIDNLEQHRFHLSNGWPEILFFMERVAGYPILLDILGVTLSLASKGPGVSRKALARVYGVSRPHVSGLLAHGEGQGWLCTHGERNGLTIHGPVIRRLKLWGAREIAWTIMAFHAVQI
jgi:hypothetical protein